jgi:hypothetical protein
VEILAVVIWEKIWKGEESKIKRKNEEKKEKRRKRVGNKRYNKCLIDLRRRTNETAP